MGNRAEVYGEVLYTPLNLVVKLKLALNNFFLIPISSSEAPKLLKRSSL